MYLIFLWIMGLIFNCDQFDKIDHNLGIVATIYSYYWMIIREHTLIERGRYGGGVPHPINKLGWGGEYGGTPQPTPNK